MPHGQPPHERPGQEERILEGGWGGAGGGRGRRRRGGSSRSRSAERHDDAFSPCCCPLPWSLVWPRDPVLSNVMTVTPQHFPA